MKDFEYICMVFNTNTGLYDKLGRPMQNKRLAEARAIEYANDRNRYLCYQLYDTSKLKFIRRIVLTNYGEWVPIGPLLTMDEVRKNLQEGLPLEAFFDICSGQDCDIYKADEFIPGDKVIYIPDLELNDIAVSRGNLDDEEIEHILSDCYTGDDFLHLVDGDMDKAKILFDYVDWQHPSSALDGDGLFDEEEE